MPPSNKRIHNKVFAELALVAMISNGCINGSGSVLGRFDWPIPKQLDMARRIRSGLELIRFQSPNIPNWEEIRFHFEVMKLEAEKQTHPRPSRKKYEGQKGRIFIPDQADWISEKGLERNRKECMSV